MNGLGFGRVRLVRGAHVELSGEPIVCVVDDDEAVRDSLRLLLEEHGFTVSEFATCEAFLAGAIERRPGCLILDLHLPGMDGLTLMRRIAADGGRVPVIAITGRSDPVTVSAVQAAGAIALLEKPFEHHQLLDAVNRALSRA